MLHPGPWAWRELQYPGLRNHLVPGQGRAASLVLFQTLIKLFPTVIVLKEHSSHPPPPITEKQVWPRNRLRCSHVVNKEWDPVRWTLALLLLMLFPHYPVASLTHSGMASAELHPHP